VSVLLKLASRLPNNWIHAFGRFRSRAPWIKRATDWIPDRIRRREGVIQRGVVQGLRFNPGGSATGFLLGTHDPGIQRALSVLLKPGMVVYDVGANVGFTAIIAAHCVGSAGRVICFEPQPSCFKLIQHNAAINGYKHVEVRGEALGEENGSASFVVTNNSTFSHLANGTTQQAKGTNIDVTVRRLDSLVADESLPKPDLIKIDVEGAEQQMLNGAMATLREAKPILLIELHGTNTVVSDALTAAGYTSSIVGSRDNILDAHWNALVIGIPPERNDIQAVLLQLNENLL
jgi:FkbM family methyltransferase